MTPQFIALLAADVALFVIAFGVLRLYRPRQLAISPAQAAQPAPQRRSTHDVIYIDTSWHGAGVAVHRAEREGYKPTNRSGTLVTYVRNGSATR